MDGENNTTAPATATCDLRLTTDEKRRKATHRFELLKRWRMAERAAAVLGFDKAAATGRFIQQLYLETGEEVCRGTLYRWDRAYRRSGLAGLIDRRGGKSPGQV